MTGAQASRLPRERVKRRSRTLASGSLHLQGNFSPLRLRRSRWQTGQARRLRSSHVTYVKSCWQRLRQSSILLLYFLAELIG